MPSKTDLVSSLLSIEKTSENVFRSKPPHIGGVIGPNRLFGGYIAAQVYLAAREWKMKNGDDRVISSMHYNFVSAGDPQKQIFLKLDQHENIYAIDVSHDHKIIGLAHVKLDTKFMERPDMEVFFPHMTNCPAVESVIEKIPNEARRYHFCTLFKQLIFQVRPYRLIRNISRKEHKVAFYARVYPECLTLLGEDSGMVAAVALSDFFVMQSIQNLVRECGWESTTSASLHHKIHFHTDYVQADQWFFVETKTEMAGGNKAKIFGHLYDSNKQCVMSFIQESYCVTRLPENNVQSKI